MGSGVINTRLRALLVSLGLYQTRTELIRVALLYDVIVIDEPYFYYARGGGTKAASEYHWELQLLIRNLLQANPKLRILVSKTEAAV